MKHPAFATLNEAFRYCRDMDASLTERLEAFSEATRYLIPGYQEAVDRMVGRLKAYDAGQSAPKPGEKMPPFRSPSGSGRGYPRRRKRRRLLHGNALRCL